MALKSRTHLAGKATMASTPIASAEDYHEQAINAFERGETPERRSLPLCVPRPGFRIYGSVRPPGPNRDS